MERLDRRLAEAAAALATLDELAGKSKRTLVERDSAVLRLIYSYEAVWKACQKVLAAMENVSAASPNATVRAARALGWLSDENAQAAIRLGEERNLAVDMDRDQVAQQIERHLEQAERARRAHLGDDAQSLVARQQRRQRAPHHCVIFEQHQSRFHGHPSPSPGPHRL